MAKRQSNFIKTKSQDIQGPMICQGFPIEPLFLPLSEIRLGNLRKKVTIKMGI